MNIPKESIDREQIEILGKSGDICVVYGHKFTDGPVYLTNPPIPTRICEICGLKEEFRPGRWS